MSSSLGKGWTLLLVTALSVAALAAALPILQGPASVAPAGPVRIAAGATILGEYPQPLSTIGSSTPTISVAYADPNGILGALFYLDGMNLTSAGTVTEELFTLPLAVELRNGPHVANFTVIDGLGVPAFDNWTFTVDTVPPILVLTSPVYPAVPAHGVYVNGTATVASPLFLGALPIAVDAKVLPSGADVPLPVSPAGAFTGLVPLTEGVNTILVNATDAVGNVATEIKTILSDTVPPALAVLTPANLSVLNHSVVPVAGLAEFGAYLSVNGISVLVNPNGTWSVDLALPDGIDLVKVVEADQVGNVNYDVRVVVVDTVAPKVVLTSPLVPITNSSHVLVSGIATDANLYAVLVNGQPTTFDPTTGAFARTLSLPDGTWPIVVVAVDIAQNAGTAQAGILVDTTPPAVRVTSPPNGLETNRSTALVTGTVDDANATVLVNGQEVRPSPDGTWRTTVALLDGANGVRVSAQDLAGNRAPAVVLTITYTPPFADLDGRIAQAEHDLAVWSGTVTLTLVAALVGLLVLLALVYIRMDRRIVALRGGRRPAAPKAAPKAEAPKPEAKGPPKG